MLDELKELNEFKELSLPTFAEELRQQSFWHSFLSCKTYVLTPYLPDMRGSVSN